MVKHQYLLQVAFITAAMVCLCSLGSWVGVSKIKELLTYVFYMRNMPTQLLTFQNGVFSQDSCYRLMLSCVEKKLLLESLISLL